jgi:hypothetical protein
MMGSIAHFIAPWLTGSGIRVYLQREKTQTLPGIELHNRTYWAIAVYLVAKEDYWRLKSTTFWDATPCSLIGVYWRSKRNVLPPSSGSNVSQESTLLTAWLTYSSTWRWRHTFFLDVGKLLSVSTAWELSHRNENLRSNSLKFNLFFVCLVSCSIYTRPPSYALSFPRHYESIPQRIQLWWPFNCYQQIRTTFAYVLLYVLDYHMEMVFRSNICCNIVCVVNRDINIILIHMLCSDYRYLSKFVLK